MSFKELMRKKFMPLKPTPEDEVFAQYVMNNTYCLPNGADPEKISVKFINDFYKFGGEEHFLVGGKSQIIDVLARNVTIHLEQEVSEINSSNVRTPITVTTSAGRRFVAD